MRDRILITVAVLLFCLCMLMLDFYQCTHNSDVPIRCSETCL